MPNVVKKWFDKRTTLQLIVVSSVVTGILLGDGLSQLQRVHLALWGFLALALGIVAAYVALRLEADRQINAAFADLDEAKRKYEELKAIIDTVDAPAVHKGFVFSLTLHRTDPKDGIDTMAAVIRHQDETVPPPVVAEALFAAGKAMTNRYRKRIAEAN